MNRILLTGGLVYDGSGADGAERDILLSGDTVAEVAPHLAADAGDALIIDCSDCAVAPGFIDIHGHSDFAVLAYPLAESRVMAGVTTELAGNCGGSPFPLGGALTERRGLELRAMDVCLDWSDAAGYAVHLAARGSSMNVAVLIGHGNLRALTVGYDDRPATPDEIDRMAAMLAEGIQAGAYGLSSGLVYPPGCFASTDEVAALAHVAGRLDGLYASHIRNEGSRLLEAVEEFLAIIRHGRCRGIISHLKTMGPANWPKIDRLIATIDQARSDGLQVFADRYPYLASMTGLDSILFPRWVHEGGIQAELQRLSDPSLRDALRRDVAAAHPEPDWADRIRICGCTTAANAATAGFSLSRLARHFGAEPLEAAIRLLIEEQTCVTAVCFGMNEDNLKRILGLPYVCVASDSSVRSLPASGNSKPHPRSFGTPVRFLADYVRDAGLMSWGEGIRRLTGLPAEILGWKRRGRLAPGAAADLVVFRPDELADRATYEAPAAAPDGIRHVLVAGEFVVRNGEHTGAKPGKLIRRGEPE